MIKDFVGHCAQLLRDTIAPAIPRGRPVALVDFPESANCGEHAVWLGEKKLLSELGAVIAYECSAQNYDAAAMAAKLGNGTILFHGGSKFSERHPRQSDLRQRVTQHFLQNKIIFFPQQVTQSDEAQVEQMAAAIGAHPDVTFFARSNVSKGLFTRYLGNKTRVLLAPDMSLLLGPQQRAIEPDYDIVWLARTDKEQDERTEAAARLSSTAPEKISLARYDDGVDFGVVVKQRPPTVLLTDWSSLVFENAEARLYFYGLPFDARSEAYFRRALHVLSMGRIVITDRLHGHLFCLMLGIPHVLLDNPSGKNRQFYETWTHGAELCRIAKTPAEAWSLARAALPSLKERDGQWTWANNGEPQ